MKQLKKETRDLSPDKSGSVNAPGPKELAEKTEGAVVQLKEENSVTQNLSRETVLREDEVLAPQNCESVEKHEPDSVDLKQEIMESQNIELTEETEPIKELIYPFQSCEEPQNKPIEKDLSNIDDCSLNHGNDADQETKVSVVQVEKQPSLDLQKGKSDVKEKGSSVRKRKKRADLVLNKRKTNKGSKDSALVSEDKSSLTRLHESSEEKQDSLQPSEDRSSSTPQKEEPLQKKGKVGRPKKHLNPENSESTNQESSRISRYPTRKLANSKMKEIIESIEAPKTLKSNKKLSKIKKSKMKVKKETIEDDDFTVVAPKKKVKKRKSSLTLDVEKIISKSVVCEECGRKFCDMGSMKRHQRKFHSAEYKYKPPPKILCGVCRFAVHTYEDLDTHVLKTHEVQIENESISFKSTDEFDSWLHSVELNDKSKFIRRTSKKLDASEIVYYQCNRSGSYRTSLKTPERKRNMKRQGTSKTSAYCPARIRVIFSKNSVDVKYCKTHLGHEKELEHLPLLPTLQQEIISKIEAKVPIVDILNGVKSDNDKSAERRALTRQDVINISNRFGLGKVGQYADDEPKVAKWIEEQNALGDQSSVIVHKPKGTLMTDYPLLETDDFLLGIMTPYQSDVFPLLCQSGCICIDTVNDANAYGHKLLSISTLDKRGRWFPCVYFVSNRLDEASFYVLLMHVRGKVGLIKASVIMSEINDELYRSWVSVMSDGSKRVICSWNVMSDWQLNSSSITCPDKKKKTLDKLQTLLHEHNEANFQTMLSELLDSFVDDGDTKQFSRYFVEKFANNPQNWALCFLKNVGVSAVGNLEKLHHMLRHAHLRRRKVKRLFFIINALLKLVKFRKPQRSVISTPKSAGPISPYRELKRRHRLSFSLDFNHVQQIADDSWSVNCANGTFVVTRRDMFCPCTLVCDPCRVCVHQYQCSCDDSVLRGNMCKHTHLVCRVLSCEREFEDRGDNEVACVDETESHLLIDETDKGVSTQTIVHLDVEPDRNLEDLKMETLDDFLSVLNAVQSKEQLATVQRMIDSCKPIIEATAASTVEMKETAVMTTPTNIITPTTIMTAPTVIECTPSLIQAPTPTLQPARPLLPARSLLQPVVVPVRIINQDSLQVQQPRVIKKNVNVCRSPNKLRMSPYPTEIVYKITNAVPKSQPEPVIVSREQESALQKQPTDYYLDIEPPNGVMEVVLESCEF